MLIAGRFLNDGLEWERGAVEIADGKVARFMGAPPQPDLDAEDGWIAPGFIDLQVNGADGVDLTSADDPEAAVATVARALVRFGVTSFCPTIITSPAESVLRRLPSLAPREHPGGARSLGAHVEGPFINPAAHRAHNLDHVRPPTIAEIDRWLAAAAPPAIVTLAPEVDGGTDAIARLRAAGTVVSLGHSEASADQASVGLAAGATMGTHIFTAMPPLHHRAPGLVGALLGSRATVGLIADGVHADRLVASLVIRAAGVDRVALVSDAASAAGAGPGQFELGDQTIVSDGVTVRRLDGTMAGSAAMLDVGLRNVRDWCPWLTRGQIVEMATSTPARALGRRVRIDEGRPADLVVLDRDWHVRATIVGGELVYQRG